MVAIVVVGLCIIGCAFSNDRFSKTSLGGRWTEVDPIGDGTVSVSKGAVNLAIPSGKDHDDWPNATPVNRTLRVVQPLSQGDWTVETKILNTDVDAGRFAGMLIEADGNHFIRSDWDGDGENVALYVGVWNGGSSFAEKYNRPVGNQAVQWQRIAKVGTTYTFSTSTDGESWARRARFTWTPTPKLIGLNVGNSVGTPAYNARFDYMINR